ncbi:hypothetical protein BJ166DRAFT_500417 [Pestalotiopsis sp. NC0098]|nr:hypothetical protein BJ166DRAFT_500417 [Pestalotiopsis sp. NC0098]
MDFNGGFGSASTAGHGIDTESRLHAQGSWERNDQPPAYRVVTAASPPTCPHSSSVEAPICWDCTEAGHVLQEDDFSRLRREGLRKQRELLCERGRHGSWTASNDSTLRTPSTLPEWHPPEPGLEAVYSSMFARGAQSEAPEWLPPEQGLEVVQPDCTEKIPVPQKRGIFQRVFKFKHHKTHSQDNCGLRRRTFYWMLACAILLVLAIVLGVVLGLKFRRRDTSPRLTASKSMACLMTALIRSRRTAYSMDDCVASCAQTSL